MASNDEASREMDSVLNRPSSLSAMINDMVDQKRDNLSLDPAEADALTNELEMAKNRSVGTTHRTPPRLGPDAQMNQKAVPNAASDLDILQQPAGNESPDELEIKDHSLDGSHQGAEHASDSDQSERRSSTEIIHAPSGCHDTVTHDDLTDLMTSLDDLVAIKVKELETMVVSRLKAADKRARDLEQKFSRVLTDLSNARIDIAQLKATPRAVVASATTTVTPSETATVHHRAPSVSALPGTQSRVQAVTQLIADCPDYPRILFVRRAKVNAAANEMGFKAPSGDVSPADWTVDGIMKHITAE